MSDKRRMLALLKSHFGYDHFRPLQEEIITKVLAKKDTLALMPSGGGKSLCYQLPALCFDGLTLVVSPLIALMKDQVDALKSNGISAEFINSTLAPAEIARVQTQAKGGQLKILYLAPERLALSGFRSFLGALHVSLIAIDEAHCISEWGHDFRPDYRNLRILRHDFPAVPVIALTATAAEKVREDILAQLELRQAQTFLSNLNRANLTYLVQAKNGALSALVDLLQKHKDEPAIVYCFSRKDTEALAAGLSAKGLKALPYHAGLDSAVRTETQEKFIRDEVPIIAATIAFGMGIDKPDIGLIVHYALPKTLEGYYQETGRAGRDGLPSECVLFYSYGDRYNWDYFINKYEDSVERENARQKLAQVIEFCQIRTCRRKFLLEYFGEKWPGENCGGCDVCLKKYPTLSVTQNRRPLLKRREGPFPAKPKLKADTPSPRRPGDLEYDQELFEQLRRLRKRLADTKGVPPYVIFGDWSLQQMAFYLPQRSETFAQISGVGRYKLDQFSEAFLEVIRRHAFEHKLAERSIPPKPQNTNWGAPRAGSTDDKNKRPLQQTPLSWADRVLASKRYDETKKLLQQKLSIREIATRRRLAESTIIRHLERLAEAGARLDLEHLIPSPERTAKIKVAIQEAESRHLTPTGEWTAIRESMGEEFSYEETRLVVLYLRQMAQDSPP
jgi:RecQ family ATP-dependent DNA helicase